MVANVLEVSVDVGDKVSVGDTLLLLESMKMEIPVLAECDGEVIDVGVVPGDVIQEGDPLVVLAVVNQGHKTKADNAGAG